MVKMTNVWERTTEFLSEHGGKVFAVSVGLVFLPTLISGSLESATQPAASNSAIALVVGLVGFIMTIVSVWGGFAITALAVRPSSPSAAIGWSGRRFPVLLGISILLVLASMVFAIPFIVLLAMAGVSFEAFATTGASLPPLPSWFMPSFLGYAAIFMIAFIWIFARLAVLTPVVLVERRGFGAITRAWELTRGHTWRIIGVFVLYGVVAAIATIAIGAAAGAVGWIVTGGLTGFGIGTLIVAAAAAIVSTLLSIIQNAFIGKLYVMLAPQAELEDTFA